MTLSRGVCEDNWAVSARTQVTAGGFDCRIHISHAMPNGTFEHEFKHSGVYPTEREAVLAGLREGMVWVELKMSKTFNI